jgi:UDP-GlcNAc:undecaprenyl-phosphate GlcNAc-1-phosphate transferase
MDGLLSSIGLIICAALGRVAFVSGKDVTACVAFATVGALVAFLCFNFPPASIFLGDSGSMVIGLVVGVLSIHCYLKGPAAVALASPMVLLTIPIFDTTAAILRRKLTGRSIYCTDRSHLHHCLLRRLVNPRYVLLTVSACCLVTAAGAFAGRVLKNTRGVTDYRERIVKS